MVHRLCCTEALRPFLKTLPFCKGWFPFARDPLLQGLLLQGLVPFCKGLVPFGNDQYPFARVKGKACATKFVARAVMSKWLSRDCSWERRGPKLQTIKLSLDSYSTPSPCVNRGMVTCPHPFSRVAGWLTSLSSSLAPHKLQQPSLAKKDCQVC